MLVIADDSADAATIAADMLAQVAPHASALKLLMHASALELLPHASALKLHASTGRAACISP